MLTLEFMDKKEGESFYENVLPSNNKVDINELKKEYEGIKGYIEIPDTNISYPIVQGNDNSYYLRRLPSGEKNRRGSIYLDYRNNGFNDENTVIYGHNFNDGTMFSDLLNYESTDFYKNHKNFVIYTENGKIEVEVIAVYIADATVSELPTTFKDRAEFDSYLKMVLDNNILDNDFKVDDIEKIVSLCTCSDGSKESRLVIIGKIV